MRMVDSQADNSKLRKFGTISLFLFFSDELAEMDDMELIEQGGSNDAQILSKRIASLFQFILVQTNRPKFLKPAVNTLVNDSFPEKRKLAFKESPLDFCCLIFV